MTKASIAIGPNRKLKIEFHQGARGHRIIRINRMPSISVPQDAYKFVAALDRLIGQLPVKKPANSEDIVSEQVLAFQMLEEGLHYDFHLSILWHPESGQWHLKIRSVKTVQEHKEKGNHFPLWALPWLRQQMATILMEHDGTERIDEMPIIPEWVTRDAPSIEQQEQQLNVEQQKVPEKKCYKQAKPLDLTPNIRIRSGRRLFIQCQQWEESGQKFLKIYKYRSEWPCPKYLPNILVPEGAYKFVAAMDEVIRKLPVKEPQHPEGDESPLILATNIVEGAPHYNFKLSAWHQKDDKWHLEIKSLKIPKQQKHKERLLRIPISALPELRQQMVKMLAEHDGTDRIDVMPTIREWATRDAPNFEQQEPQPDEEQEQVTDENSDAEYDWEMHTDAFIEEMIGQSRHGKRSKLRHLLL